MSKGGDLSCDTDFTIHFLNYHIYRKNKMQVKFYNVLCSHKQYWYLNVVHVLIYNYHIFASGSGLSRGHRGRDRMVVGFPTQMRCTRYNSV